MNEKNKKTAVNTNTTIVIISKADASDWTSVTVDEIELILLDTFPLTWKISTKDSNDNLIITYL